MFKLENVIKFQIAISKKELYILRRSKSHILALSKNFRFNVGIVHGKCILFCNHGNQNSLNIAISGLFVAMATGF